MTNEDLLSIGHFGRLAGLSVHALRHYDAVGLLAPADVDPETSYRRYRRSQLPTAKLITQLRWLDIPIDHVRILIEDPAGAGATGVLVAHLQQLARTRDLIERQLATLDNHLTKGIPVPQPITGVAPVQIKLTTLDLPRSRQFYREAFGMNEQIVRHTDDADFPGYQFGSYAQPDFFLLNLVDSNDFDAPGVSTFGLLVADLEQVHAAALTAGATEAVPVHEAAGMPASSAVKDPDGNWIWLYQS